MKAKLTLVAAALAAGSTCAVAQQAPTLSTTLLAPAELNLGAVDLYQIRVRNTASVATAFNVVVRLNLPAGLELQAPIPQGCAVTTENYGPTPNVRQVKCAIAGIGGGRTRFFDLFVLAQSQPAGNPVVHRARVTQSTSTSVSMSSLQPGTNYQHFSLPITPGTLWTSTYCWNASGTVQVPHAICTPYPTTTMEGGKVRLQVGGYIDSLEMPGPSSMTWLQTSPTELRYDEAPDPANANPGGYANLRLVNSRCFRGQTFSNPVPGQPQYYTGLQLCK